MKLQEMRRERGMSQKKLATEAGINVRTLQCYEQGAKNFNRARIDTILKCAIALDCKINEILDDDECLNLLFIYQKRREK